MTIVGSREFFSFGTYLDMNFCSIIVRVESLNLLIQWMAVAHDKYVLGFGPDIVGSEPCSSKDKVAYSFYFAFPQACNAFIVFFHLDS